MHDIQKIGLIQALRQNITALGSQSAAARKCGVSDAVITQILNGTYAAKGDDMYYKIAAAIGYSFTEGGWATVETRNYMMVRTVLDDARQNAQFKAISERAGSGKTTTTKLFARENPTAVFRLECREWSRGRFMEALMKALGLPLTNNVDDFIESISSFFKRKGAERPLLIIDEADKLKPAALRLLIPLYNECEGELGVVICGTDNLEKEIKRGVKYAQKGFDELFSRFGRSFVHLVGEDLQSVRAICKANGITDPSVCKRIFESCEVNTRLVGNAYEKTVNDLRQLRAKIEGYKISIAA
jgi:DNA transposition AAA+ family ATPase